MSDSIIIIISIVCLLTSAGLTKWLIAYLTSKGIMDTPNHRSSHEIPTPRGGGIAIAISLAIGFILMALAGGSDLLPGYLFFAGLFLVALIGFLDDKLNFPAGLRFFVQILAAALVIYETGGLSQLPLPAPYNMEIGSWGYALALLWIVGLMNIYNFLDGIDGLAGLQAVLAGVGIAILDPTGPGMIIGVLVTSSSLGFLFFNWHKARIFMGDVGSVSLGFIFSAIPFYFKGIDSSLGVYLVVLILWFFLSDGIFTILRRLSKGEKIWQAHRSHLYQRLVISGLSHSVVTRSVMIAAAMLIALTIYFYFYQVDWLIFVLSIALLMFVIYLAWVTKREREV